MPALCYSGCTASKAGNPENDMILINSTVSAADGAEVEVTLYVNEDNKYVVTFHGQDMPSHAPIESFRMAMRHYNQIVTDFLENHG